MTFDFIFIHRLWLSYYCFNSKLKWHHINYAYIYIILYCYLRIIKCCCYAQAGDIRGGNQTSKAVHRQEIFKAMTSTTLQAHTIHQLPRGRHPPPVPSKVAPSPEPSWNPTYLQPSSFKADLGRPRRCTGQRHPRIHRPPSSEPPPSKPLRSTTF